MITLKDQANEAGTYVVSFYFKDEDENPTVPNYLNWTLTDEVGNIINEREAVSIDADKLASSMYITLTGSDLPPGYKILTIHGTYNSTYGTNLPLRQSVKFYVVNLVDNDLDISDVVTDNVYVRTIFGRTGNVTAQTGDYTWNQIDKTDSDIADITDRSHIDLTDVGTLTHEDLESSIDNLESDVTWLSGQIGTGGTDSTEDVNFLSGQIDENTGNISILETSVNDNTSAINDNLNDINNLESDVNWLSGEIGKSVYDDSLSTDHSYSGSVFEVTVGENVVFGDFLYINRNDEKWYKAQSDNLTTMPATNMAVENKNTNERCYVLDIGGIARDDSWSWTMEMSAGFELYLDHEISGDLSETPPLSSGYYGQIVAIPLASNKIKLLPSLNIARY